ncbi:hypothetical protein MMC13_000847 [Lambiella insularis]|nr:hypothetical protein [Lambiella insularis]
MAWKSKFNIPALSRGQSYEGNDRAVSKKRAPLSGPSSPAMGSMSKAEELLGHSEQFGNAHHLEEPGKGNIRDRLRRQRSSLSIAVSDSKPNGAKAYRRMKEGKRTQASSPILGPTDNLSVTSLSGRSIRSKPSTSTLQSHYDPTESPLSVSQQTSASSARDMALRKGYPRILYPPPQAACERLSDQRRPPVHNGKSQAEPIRKRTPNLRLYAALEKAQSVPCSPSVIVAGSEIQPPLSPTLRNWFGRKMSKMSKMSKMIAQPRASAVVIQEDWQVEVDKRLATVPFTLQLPQPKKDVENWLDDAELEDTFDTMGENSTLQMFVKADRSSLNSSAESSDNSSSSVRTLTSQVSGMASRRQSLHNPQSRPASEREGVMRSQRPKVARISRITNSDLHSESVLALSSSDEDSESETDTRKIVRHVSMKHTPAGNTQPLVSPENNRPVTPNRHRKGWSAEKASLNSRRPSSASQRSQSPSPSQTAGKPHHRQSSVHWHPDMVRNRHPLHPSSQSSPARKKSNSSHSNDDHPSTPTSLAYLRDDIPHIRLSRMMAVTPEEEKLLSAMRDKRASMRKAVLSEGILLAVEHGLTARRPKTADAGNGSASFFAADMTCFPKPPGMGSSRQHIGTIQTLARATVSSEDLRLGGFDAIPSSSSLSSTDSGILPSPTLSHDDPLTPASGKYSMGPDGFRNETSERFDEFGSEGQAKGDLGHASKRTMSSILCLDGVEERARAREEEEDIVMWRIDRCI